MHKYTIDFTNVEHYTELHKVIKKSLKFPDYYGENWSAFRDCLTDMYGEPVYIEIIGLDVIEEKFEEAAEKMIEILKQWKHYDKAFEQDIKIEISDGSTAKVLI